MKTHNECSILSQNSEKLLSICMAGKDDDYMVDFKYRITTVLNHFAQNIDRIGKIQDVELVIVDWGSTPPMAQTLSLSPAAAKICRFIYVSPAIIHETQEGKDYFHSTRSINTFLRRANGQFIMFTCSDELMLHSSLNSVLQLLHGEIQLPLDVHNTLFLLPRKQIPWQFVNRQPRLEDWDSYIILNDFNLEQEDNKILHSFGGTAAFLAHKTIWHELRGFDERLQGWGWSDIELGYRASQNYPFLFLSSINAMMYHMGHPPTGRRKTATKIDNQNPQIYNATLQVNDNSWGLGNYSLEEMKAEISSDSASTTHNDNYGAVNNNSLSNKSVDQIKIEIQDAVLKENVQKIISMFTQNGWEFDACDLYAMLFLYWYSSNYYPRNYVEYGFGKGYSAAVVAQPCPSVRIFGVDLWEGMISVRRPYIIPYFLDALKFRGYIRFVNGDVTSAFERIQNSFPSQIKFDLAFVRIHNLGEKAFDIISDIICSLSVEGVLIFVCPTLDSYQEIINKILSSLPQKRLLLSDNDKTGIILPGNFQKDDPHETELSEAYHDTSSPPHIDKTQLPEYRFIKTAAFFLSSREAYRHTMFSANEVFCSPDCQTTSSNGLKKTIQTQPGVFEIRQIINQLPAIQQPELIVVKTDATGRNFPVNLKQYNCPKLLILGDTHHLNRPIRTLMTYATQENFDFIISDHDRQHLHFFREAGFQNVYWIPCLNINPHEQPVIEDKIYDVTFVGQVGRWHPNRKTVLQFLTSNGIDVKIMQASHEQTAEIYAKSLINLNISLNGDLNLRVFEVISSRGFLLTDRLSKESGLETIFKDGEHLVCYDGPQDLLEKIQYYLKHPTEAKSIANSGYEHYKKFHTPETKIQELMTAVFKGKVNPLYDIQKDRRSVLVKSQSSEELFKRISIYEYFQDIHLRNQKLTVLFSEYVDPRIICDVSDLMRLQIVIKGNAADIPDSDVRMFNDMGITDRIHVISSHELKNIQNLCDIVLLTPTDLSQPELEELCTTLNFKLLVLTGDLDFMSESDQNNLQNFLMEIGFKKIQKDPVVFHWQDKSLWGDYLYSKGQTELALKIFEFELMENPANENALNSLGVISYQLNRLEDAEIFLEKAVSMNRQNLSYLNNLVQLYITLERFDAASGLLQEIVRIRSDLPESWYLLGICLEKLKHAHEAMAAYRKARMLGGEKYSVPENLVDVMDHSLVVKTASCSIMPPKKIIVINNLYPPQELGGYGRLLFDFTNILKKRGHEVYVLTSDTPYLGSVERVEPGVDRRLELCGGWEGGVCKYSENMDEIVRTVRRNDILLNEVMAKFTPDVCLMGNIDFLSRNIMDPLIDKNIPIVHHLGNQIPSYAVHETPMSPLYHLAAASQWVKEIVQSKGYPLKDVSIVYPGALVEEFRMRIPPAVDKLRIAYASIVLPYKGPHILIGALQKLHDAGIDFSCSIAGTSTDGDFVNRLKAYVLQTGMDEKIRFVGNLKREELKQLFARHNVLVFPSIVQEAFGISQVEAMAAGLAVVTSATGGAHEIIENDVSGVVFKSEDADSLANELARLQKNPERLRRIAISGQRRAIEKFDIEKSVDELESLFSRLLRDKQGKV